MKCESCGGTENIVGVASVPGVPYSAAYCAGCLKANSHPMWVLLANTACCGGLGHTNADWQQMVMDSLKHQNKTLEWFNEQVAAAGADLNRQGDTDRAEEPREIIEAENVVLREALIQAQHTVRFLHDALKDACKRYPSVLIFRHPQHILAKLEYWASLQPLPNTCQHSVTQVDCLGCQERVDRRRHHTEALDLLKRANRIRHANPQDGAQVQTAADPANASEAKA